MDRKSKVLFLFMFVLCAFSITALYYKAVIQQNFDIVKVYEDSEEDDTEIVSE